MKKFWKLILFALILMGLLAAYAYYVMYAPNIADDAPEIFYIPTDENSEQLIARLADEGIVKHPGNIEKTCKLIQFHRSKVKPGRYLIDRDMSSYALLNKLRRGLQDPLLLKIQGARKYSDLAGQVAHQLMYDSLAYLDAIVEVNRDEAKILCAFLPDSYEVFWTLDPEDFVRRMKSESRKYWERQADALQSLNMNSCEVYTLASIVEKETNYNPEKQRLAGVYLNRLRLSMPLQADPTVVYANGDFSLRRVLNKHLSYPSPYNTYLHIGLPPGPICMPSKASIEAVLHAEQHDYLYFCAKPDNSMTHVFAKTLAQHNKNARAFHSWLNNRSIYQ